jgi:hypothetical protein
MRYLETVENRAAQPSETGGRYSDPNGAIQALTTHRRPLLIATERACSDATAGGTSDVPKPARPCPRCGWAQVVVTVTEVLDWERVGKHGLR